MIENNSFISSWNREISIFMSIDHWWTRSFCLVNLFVPKEIDESFRKGKKEVKNEDGVKTEPVSPSHLHLFHRIRISHQVHLSFRLFISSFYLIDYWIWILNLTIIFQYFHTSEILNFYRLKMESVRKKVSLFSFFTEFHKISVRKVSQFFISWHLSQCTWSCHAIIRHHLSIWHFWHPKAVKTNATLTKAKNEDEEEKLVEKQADTSSQDLKKTKEFYEDVDNTSFDELFEVDEVNANGKRVNNAAATPSPKTKAKTS